jgi:phospho-N-acetylmuramoyl-pentapeptide-transferase
MVLSGLFVTSLPVAVFSAGVISLLLTLVAGSRLIRWLSFRWTERIASDSMQLNELHAGKGNTPTMGGLLIAGATIVSILCCADLHSPITWLFCLAIASFTILGASDDWIKLRTSRKGLSARQKLLFQGMIASMAVAGIYWHRFESGNAGHVVVPWLTKSLYLGWYWIPWAVFVIVGTSNAVNLTDGLDGLACGSAAIASIGFAVVVAGTSKAGIDNSIHVLSGISFGALAGSTLGFLRWNHHPARIFMGDAGSLPIGGLLAMAALATGNELLLTIIGAVFVIETLSVILQVAWYRRTQRRILLCSPLHNHFVFLKIPEQRIVAAFWIVAMIAVLAGLTAVAW